MGSKVQNVIKETTDTVKAQQLRNEVAVAISSFDSHLQSCLDKVGLYVPKNQ